MGRNGRIVGASALTILILALNLSAQVNVKSSLFQDREVVPGEEYFIEAEVLNSSDTAIEIRIRKLDYLYENGQHKFLSSGSVERSNGSWITVEYSRMLLPAKRKTTIQFPVKIPDDVGIGTYHSIIGIETVPTAISAEKSVAFNTRYHIQVVSNVESEKARKGLKIVKTEVKENSLLLTIRNTGERILTFSIKPPIPEIQDNRRARIYPSMEETIELDISKLADGEYEDLRFIFDDGRNFIQPAFVTFMKGELPEKAELYVLEGESLEKKARKARPAFLPRLYAIISIGDKYRALSLSGNVNLFKNLISLQAGSDYREFGYLVSDKNLTHRLGAGLRLKNFSLNYSAYVFENSVFEMAGANYQYKNLRINTNYIFDRKIFQGSLNQRFWRRWSIRLYGFFDFETHKKRYVWSLVIPIF